MTNNTTAGFSIVNYFIKAEIFVFIQQRYDWNGSAFVIMQHYVTSNNKTLLIHYLFVVLWTDIQKWFSYPYEELGATALVYYFWDN